MGGLPASLKGRQLENEVFVRDLHRLKVDKLKTQPTLEFFHLRTSVKEQADKLTTIISCQTSKINYIIYIDKFKKKLARPPYLILDNLKAPIQRALAYWLLGDCGDLS